MSKSVGIEGGTEYEQYVKHENPRQLVAEVPWGHNLLIMSKISDYEARAYYLERAK